MGKAKSKVNGYMYFVENNRQKIREKLGRHASTDEVNNEISRLWQNLPASEKAELKLAAQEDAERQKFAPPRQPTATEISERLQKHIQHESVVAPKPQRVRTKPPIPTRNIIDGPTQFYDMDADQESWLRMRRNSRKNVIEQLEWKDKFSSSKHHTDSAGSSGARVCHSSFERESSSASSSSQPTTAADANTSSSRPPSKSSRPKLTTLQSALLRRSYYLLCISMQHHMFLSPDVLLHPQQLDSVRPQEVCLVKFSLTDGVRSIKHLHVHCARAPTPTGAGGVGRGSELQTGSRRVYVNRKYDEPDPDEFDAPEVPPEHTVSCDEVLKRLEKALEGQHQPARIYIVSKYWNSAQAALGYLQRNRQQPPSKHDVSANSIMCIEDLFRVLLQIFSRAADNATPVISADEQAANERVAAAYEELLSTDTMYTSSSERVRPLNTLQHEAAFACHLHRNSSGQQQCALAQAKATLYLLLSMFKEHALIGSRVIDADKMLFAADKVPINEIEHKDKAKSSSSSTSTSVSNTKTAATVKTPDVLNPIQNKLRVPRAIPHKPSASAPTPMLPIDEDVDGEHTRSTSTATSPLPPPEPEPDTPPPPLQRPQPPEPELTVAPYQLLTSTREKLRWQHVADFLCRLQLDDIEALLLPQDDNNTSAAQ